MASPSLRKPPKYRLHKPTGRAVVTLSGKDFYLGEHGAPESHEAYDRVVREWLQAGRIVAKASTLGGGPSIAEVCLGYWRRCEEHYRHPDGTPTRSTDQTRVAIRILRQQYGGSLAAEFGPLKLQAVRQSLIERDLSRTYINKLIDEIKRIFRWAAAQELIPAMVYHGLRSVENLRAGRSKARETAPVGPVDLETVEKTLLHLPPVTADLLRIMLRTGCRPGEACAIKPAEIDTSGDVWLYTPGRHKTAHHGRKRVIPIGPQGQAILLAYLDRDEDEYCFSPRESEQLRKLEMRRRRKTKVQPSQKDRSRSNPKRTPADRYAPKTLSQAVRRACKKARIPTWSPNQIRHAVATEVRAEFGIDRARTVLGHGSASTTEIYAEMDLSQAKEIARKRG